MKNAVILDGHTANPGDLSWSDLEEIVDLTVYDRTAKEQTIERIGNSEIVMTNKVIIDQEVIESCPNLRYVGVMATGFNVVDLDSTRDKGIVVTNIPAYSTSSVAQHVFGSILEFASGISAHDRSVHDGDWVGSADFSYTMFSLREIAEQTLGVIGYGAIGKEVVKIAKAFGMRVLVESRYPDESSGAEFVNRDALLNDSDYVTIHTVLNDTNSEMVNKAFLSQMKSTSILINTGRGGLVNEKDLSDALSQGVIGGAALDVLSTEPPAKDNPLLEAPNCIITPHVAWATKEARSRLIQTLTENVKRYLQGDVVNQVN